MPEEEKGPGVGTPSASAASGHFAQVMLAQFVVELAWEARKVPDAEHLALAFSESSRDTVARSSRRPGATREPTWMERMDQLAGRDRRLSAQHVEAVSQLLGRAQFENRITQGELSDRRAQLADRDVVRVRDLDALIGDLPIGADKAPGPFRTDVRGRPVPTYDQIEALRTRYQRGGRGPIPAVARGLRQWASVFTGGRPR